jgi:ABC-2 type transport system ATP-binding protein
MDAITADDVYKSYGSIKAVDGISFKVQKGEVYSFLGPNGAGKTTTVEMLEGLRKADRGEIRVLGEEPWHEASKLGRTVGVMPQDFRFIERITSREAIRYYCSLFSVRDKTKELLSLVDLEEVQNVQFQNLSGGQKQKLGICLALINDPELIFLDEPTTGLDPKARRKIWDLIRKLKDEGKTVILTTHYLEEAEMLADRVAIMDHGKIIAEGSPGEIINRMGKGRKLTVPYGEKLLDYLSKDLKLDCNRTGDSISVSIHSNKDVINILDFAEKNGIELTSLSLKEDTLEDIFVDLIAEKEGTS